MSFEMIITIILLLVFLGTGISIYYIKKPKKLNTQEFGSKWKELQGYCRDKRTWPNALEEADLLLDKALRKRRYKGESMGERMVSAQKTFSDNDGVWFAHNLYKKIVATPNAKIKESDVKDALLAYRQSLRDLGALPQSQKNKPLRVEK